MGSSKYRIEKLDETSGAVAWSIDAADDFDIKRICLIFDTPPATIENVQVFLKSELGADFDCLLRAEDPNDCNSLTFENIDGIKSGDSVQVVYANTDGVTIRGTATVQL